MIPEDYSPADWRLVITQPADGAWNMSVDEALLHSMGKSDPRPVLRLYAWKPACISLGYAQPFSDIDLSRLKDKDWNLVRRITGGRAILHTDELTYAVISPYSEPRLTGSLLDSYRRLSQALLFALIKLGIPAHALPKRNKVRERPKPVCFEIPSNYEITVGGKKLIGSAQARKKTGILQHGTLPLRGDLTRILQALKFPDETSRMQAAERLLDRAVTVESVLGAPINWDTAAQALIHSFHETLRINFIQSSLSAGEQSLAETLKKEKYAHPAWTERI